MYKHTCFILLALSCLNCFSQELIKKTNLRKDGLKETFFVLKSDKSVRQGEYYLLYHGNPIQEGFYCNGKKSGIWKYSGGDSGFSYDHDSCTIVTDTIGKKRPALYSEGDIYFYYLLYSVVEYPLEAKETNVQGKIIIVFTVDIDGTPRDFEIKQGCGNLVLNNEAMRAMKETVLAFPWYPAINEKGEKIKSIVERPVSFELK
jgi:TonB family protein